MDIAKIGKAIADARNKAGMTQREVAEKIGVSNSVLNRWEDGYKLPDIDNLLLISVTLSVPFSSIIDAGAEDKEPDHMDVRDRLFDEEKMFIRLKTTADKENLPETYYALYYIREKHAGQYRNQGKYSSERVPYINHPLMMTCHAHALGIRDDHLLAAMLLHDVVEDTDVELKDLPFSKEVKILVGLVTKTQTSAGSETKAKDIYYGEISKNPKACVIKVIDRCNNVSTMAGCFSEEKMKEYILETEEYVLPLLEKLKKEFPEYSTLAFLVKYQIISILETVKYLIAK